MKDLHIIKLKKGYGPLLFGMTQEQVKEILGDPDEKETIDEGDLFQTLIWHYWCFDISVFFDLNEEGRLTAIETDHHATQLWDVQIFQLPEQEIKDLFHANGFTTMEEEMEGPEKCVSFDDCCADLYFQNGQLNSINFGVLTSEDEILLWPN